VLIAIAFRGALDDAVEFDDARARLGEEGLEARVEPPLLSRIPPEEFLVELAPHAAHDHYAAFLRGFSMRCALAPR
jgi:hypothetical protein